MKMLRITLEGKTYDVGVEVLEDTASGLSATPNSPAPSMHAAEHSPVAIAPVIASVAVAKGCRVIASPMAGKVFKCLVKPGDVVILNQVVIVLDAMKMETPVVATLAGTVRTVLVKEGDSVDEGHSLLQIEG